MGNQIAQRTKLLMGKSGHNEDASPKRCRAAVAASSGGHQRQATQAPDRTCFTGGQAAHHWLHAQQQRLLCFSSTRPSLHRSCLCCRCRLFRHLCCCCRLLRHLRCRCRRFLRTAVCRGQGPMLSLLCGSQGRQLHANARAIWLQHMRPQHLHSRGRGASAGGKAQVAQPQQQQQAGLPVVCASNVACAHAPATPCSRGSSLLDCCAQWGPSLAANKTKPNRTVSAAAGPASP